MEKTMLLTLVPTPQEFGQSMGRLHKLIKEYAVTSSMKNMPKRSLQLFDAQLRIKNCAYLLAHSRVPYKMRADNMVNSLDTDRIRSMIPKRIFVEFIVPVINHLRSSIEARRGGSVIVYAEKG